MSEKINYKRIWNNEMGSGSSGAGAVPIEILHADFLTLIADNTAQEAFYYITDGASNGSLGDIADLGIIVQVFNDTNGTNRVSLDAKGIFMNPDYQAVGDYSGISGYVSQLGVWHSGLAPVIGSVVIYNGIHYKNKTGVVGTAPSGDAANWQPFDKSTQTHGYIVEIDIVTYDYYNDSLESRTDKRGNNIGMFLNNHQWGNDSCTRIHCHAGTSNTINSRGIINSCIILGGSVLNVTNANAGSIASITLDGGVTLNADLNTGKILYNTSYHTNDTITLDPAKSISNESFIKDVSPATKIYMYNNF